VCRIVAVVLIADLQYHRITGVFSIAFVEHPGLAVLLNHACKVFAVFAGGVADVHPVAVEHVIGLAEFYHMWGLKTAGRFAQWGGLKSAGGLSEGRVSFHSNAHRFPVGVRQVLSFPAVEKSCFTIFAAGGCIANTGPYLPGAVGSPPESEIDRLLFFGSVFVVHWTAGYLPPRTFNLRYQNPL